MTGAALRASEADDRILASLEAFKRMGYAVIDGAIDGERLERLARAADDLYRRLVGCGRVRPNDRAIVSGVVGAHPAFLEVIDLAPILNFVVSALGAHIRLYHSHLNVAPPGATGWSFVHTALGRDTDTYASLVRSEDHWGWHRDGGRLCQELGPDPQPMVSLKVGIVLTDQSSRSVGNLYVVPGSHLGTPPALLDGRRPNDCEAVPILAEAGQLVVVDRRLWHSSSPNAGDQVRHVLYLGYAFRWLELQDTHGLVPSEAHDPIRAQLLGALSSPRGPAYPGNIDTPLEGWQPTEAWPGQRA